MRSYCIDNRQKIVDRITFYRRLEMIAPGYYKNDWVLEPFSETCPKPLEAIVVKSNLDPEVVSMICGGIKFTSLPDPKESWESYTEALKRSLAKDKGDFTSDYDTRV